MKLTAFLLFIALSGTLVCEAQFRKGDRMLGAAVASLVFNSGNSDIEVASIGSNTSKITSYNVVINPNYGWFVSDNMVIGGILNVNPNGNKTSYAQGGTTYQSDKSNNYNIGLGVFLRQYLKGSGLLPFGQISVNGGFSNSKTEGFFYGGSGTGAYKTAYDGNSTGGGFFNAAFTAGVTKMVTETAGLDLYIGYTYSHSNSTFKRTTTRDIGNDGTIDERLENETTTTYSNNGLLIGVGFQVFLRKKK